MRVPLTTGHFLHKSFATTGFYIENLGKGYVKRPGDLF